MSISHATRRIYDPAKPVHIVVVGSINMDLVARMARLPQPGETVTGESFQTIPGGKGANQAVAAARLGAKVTMIGRLGNDSFGTQMRRNLIEDGIDTQFVFDTPDCSSGVALIGVDASGANQITVVPGANGRLTPDDVRMGKTAFEMAHGLIVQLETPLETVAEAIRLGLQSGTLVVLDPAPVPSGALPAALMAADVISPNQTEAESLTGIKVEDWSSAESAAKELQRQGARNVVIKMGGMGALVYSREGVMNRVSACKVDVVDTTAAGDAFTAALTLALVEGKTLVDSTAFACTAGSLACTRFGAQPAMPTRAEVLRLASAEN